jgi:type III secretion protein U
MSEKKHKPTQRKLREARKEGEVVRSREIGSLAAFIGVWLCLWLGAGYWRKYLDHIIGQAARAADPVAGTGAQQPWLAPVQSLAHDMLCIVAPLLGVGITCAVLAGALQTRGLISFAPLKPKFERINPAQGLKNLFSTRHLFDLGKMLLKTTLLLGTLFYCIKGSLGSLVRATYASAADLPGIWATLAWHLMGWAAVIYIIAAVLDYAHQFYEFMKKQKMSTEELRRDHRETEGDPHIKHRRRVLGREMVFNPVALSRLASASVVVVNPTHVAVALHYQKGKSPLPRVVAKGLDAAALDIRALAEREGVPVLEDPPLARRLFREVPLDHYINEDLIDAVAAVFRWVRLVEERRGSVRLALAETESDTPHGVDQPCEVRPVDLAAESRNVHVDDVVERGSTAHIFPNLVR